MSASKPVIVLVPGAWSPASVYDSLVSALHKVGYPTSIAICPSVNSSEPLKASCSADTTAVRGHILSLIDDEGKDVIIFCHSYGGIPTGCAAVGLSKVTRAREGRKGGVLGLVYLAAFAVPENGTLLQALGGSPVPFIVWDNPSVGLCTVSDPKGVFFNDIEESYADLLVGAVGTQSTSAFETAASKPAWAEEAFQGKLAYVRCLQDQAMPSSLQDILIQKSGVDWIVKDLQSGHFPFISQVEEVVGILQEVEGVFAG